MKTFKFILAITFLIASMHSLNPLTATDMHSLNKMSSPVISSNKKYAVYVVKTWDSKTGKSASNIQAVEIATKRIVILTNSTYDQTDFNPVFSNDFPNVMLFLRNAWGSTQIWKTTFLSDKWITGSIPGATQLSNYNVDISNLKFVRKTVSFTAEVYVDCSNNFKCTADKDAEVAKRGSNTWAVYDSLFVRHWDRWLTDKVSHIFFHYLNDRAELQLDVNDLMPKMNTNSPVPPNGGLEQYDVHPNGNEIVFTGQDREYKESWSTGWKIYRSSSSMNPAQHITKNIKARTQQPKYSPDGKTVAYLAMDRIGLESDKLHLEVYDLASSSSRNITGSWDRSVIDYIWINNKEILLLATNLGVDNLFYVNIEAPQTIKTVIDDLSGTISIQLVSEDLFVLQRSSFMAPNDLFTFNLSSLKVDQLTNINQGLSKFAIITPDKFNFTGGYGDLVQGWLFKPINFDESKKYPIAFLIHGGPEGSFSSAWSYRWNPQLWTARGYAVVMINPHGSSGQGQRFQDLVRNDWGGIPYFDLMTGLDYAISHYSFLDGNRSCALGASYGGYMTNWIQGQTDRFKCLVTHDGVFSTLTMFYATEELWFPMAEYCPLDAVGCLPWDDKYRDRYIKFSPEENIANWKTPHMIIHGGKDYRIPITEGISAFTALQLKQIPSRFVHFPMENHWVLRSENSVKWYEEVLGWLDTYTGTSIEEELKEIKFLE